MIRETLMRELPTMTPFLLLVLAAGVVIVLVLGGRWLLRRINDASWRRFRAELSVPPTWKETDRERHGSSRRNGKVA